MSRVLDDVRVIDLSTGPVGGLATTVLADFGADVIKVEPPGGDRFRSLAGAPLWLRGKRSVALDARDDPEARARLLELVSGTDVLVVSGPPDRAGRLGVGYEELAARCPALVHCSITGWGASGAYAHYPGYEALVAAKSGRMLAFSGQRLRAGPAFAAVPVATHAAAQGAVHGIVAALIARERGSGGARVETSLLQGLLPYDLAGLLLVQLIAQGRAAADPAAMGGGMPTLNYHPVATADGRWIQLGNLLEHLFFAFLDATDLLPELLAEERFQGSPAAWAPDVIEKARDRILLRMRERTAEEWMRVFRAHGDVAAEPYATSQEALDQLDLVANGDISEYEHPTLGTLRQIGPIAELEATPGRAGESVPAVGEHTDAVLAEPVRSVAAGRTGDGPPPGRPLDGVTVLELATIIAAPLGTSLLADLGARVIKVEVLTGDPYRHLLPGGLLAVKTNAGKQSICIDLKSDEGQAVVRDLIAISDVLLHNFRPGVPERLGIGYEQAAAIRPDLVWVSANGYGPHGPGARRPSAHPVPGAAMGGALYQAGSHTPPAHCESLDELREAARQLMRANEPNPDPNTSVVLASATLLALLARVRHGIGQRVYVNMLVANAYANADDFVRYAGKPERAPVDGEVLGLAATWRLYPARSGWVFLAIANDAEWRSFVRLAGEDGIGDPRFATASARGEHEAELGERLAARFLERDADDWEKLLASQGVGCVRADAAQPGVFWAADEHAHANRLTEPAEHARFGPMQRWGPLVRVDGGAGDYGPGVLAGEHTDVLLRELGRSPDEIRRLRDAGVVGSEPTEASGTS